MTDVPKHVQAALWPSEVVTLGLLHAIKGVGNRAFYRWVENNYMALFPNLPHRTRLLRLLRVHQTWTDRFLASPTLLGIIDTYGIELLHPAREGRTPRQLGKKGKSNYRWIVGGKLCVVLNRWGLVTGWDCATANVYDTHFQPLVQKFSSQMVVLSDAGFHAKGGDPPNLKVCLRGQWNERMKVETVFSMLTRICHCKRMLHRAWDYFRARLAFTMAAFNLLAKWSGLQVDKSGTVHLSIAQFSL